MFVIDIWWNDVSSSVYAQKGAVVLVQQGKMAENFRHFKNIAKTAKIQILDGWNRLRAVYLFSVVHRGKRETRKWPRAWLMAWDGSRLSRLRRTRARALFSLNLNKKRDCSRSMGETALWRISATCRLNISLCPEFGEEQVIEFVN